MCLGCMVVDTCYRRVEGLSSHHSSAGAQVVKSASDTDPAGSCSDRIWGPGRIETAALVSVSQKAAVVEAT